MRKNVYVIVFACGFATLPVIAAEMIQLLPGRFSVNGNNATQMIAAKNGGPPISELVIDCGFFQGSELIGAARGSALNVKTGQTANIEVVATDAGKADHADCRVFAALPSK